MGKKRRTNKHLPQRVYLKCGAYYYVDLSNKWHLLSRSLPEALAIYAAKFAMPKRIITMNDLIDRYLCEIAPQKAKRTYRAELQYSKLIKITFGDMDPSAITPVFVYGYLDERYKKSIVSGNKEVALLSNVFSYAIRWGIVDKNPCRDIKKMSEGKRDRYISHKEFAFVKRCATPFMRAVMDLAYITGLRRGDIISLQLSQLTNEGIKVDTSKTKAKIIIEWSIKLKRCVEFLKNCRYPIRSVYLVCNQQGQPYSDSGFNSMWRRTILTAKEKAEKAGKQFEWFHFNDIRRKTATDMKKKYNVFHAQDLLTHKTPKMTDHYISGYRVAKPLK
jgi:integrase